MSVDWSEVKRTLRRTGAELLVQGGTVVLKLADNLLQPLPKHPVDHCIHPIEVLIGVSVPLGRGGGGGGRGRGRWEGRKWKKSE